MKSILLNTAAMGLGLSVVIACLPIQNRHLGAKTDLTWQTPVNIVAPSTTSLPNLQRAFDEYSWQLFTALNWPSNANGTPNTRTIIGETDSPGVWQSWKGTYDIFLPNGASPKPWGQLEPPPSACDGLAEKNLPIVRQIGKRPLLLNSDIQPFRDGPLVDQTGAYARFQISLNETMFNYIDQNSLYSKSGQQAYNGKIQFQCAISNSSTDPYDGTMGAMQVKTAWKVLDGTEKPSNFHTSVVLIYTPAAPGVTEDCSLGNVGLVGMHIGSKLPKQPQWTWSTFEHVDNAPEVGNVDAHKTYNFYKDNCSDCLPVNTQPPQPWDPNTKNKPVQVVRTIPLTKATNTINQKWQDKFKAVNPQSVWQNYMLVNTQWPTQTGFDCSTPSDPFNDFGNPAPEFLANTTLETYIQGTTPRVSSQQLPVNCTKQ